MTDEPPDARPDTDTDTDTDTDVDALQRQMRATHDAASTFAAALVGLTPDEARQRAASDGRFDVRFVPPDATVTLDFRPSRIRATIAGGAVVSATAG